MVEDPLRNGQNPRHPGRQGPPGPPDLLDQGGLL